MVDAYKTIAKGAGFVLVGLAISKLLTFLYRANVARLGSDVYGILSIGIAIVSISSFIPLLGLDVGVMRYVSYFRTVNEIRKVKGTITSSLKISLPLSIFVCVLLFLLSDFIAIKFFNNPQLSLIIKILSPTIPLFVLGNIFLSVIKAYQKIDFWVYIKLLGENIVKVLLTFLFLVTGLGVIGAATAYTTALFFTFIISFAIVETKIFPIIKTKIKSLFITRQLLNYSFPLMFTVLFSQVIVWTDILMLGYFRSASEVGIYNAALPTATIMSVIPEGITAIFLPVMTGLYAKNEKNEFETTFKASNKWIFFLILPVAIGLTLFSKDILGIMFGHEYAQSYIALIILIMGYFIYEMFVTCIEVLNVIKKTKYVMFNMLLAAILNIILNYILIPTYGMVGGAIATAGSMIIYGLLSVIEAFYFTRIWPLKMKYFKAIITGILTLIITWKIMTLIPFRNVYSLAIGLITIMISYFPLLLIFKSLEKEDIEILKAIEARSGFRFNFIRNVVKRFI